MGVSYPLGEVDCGLYPPGKALPGEDDRVVLGQSTRSTCSLDKQAWVLGNNFEQIIPT